MEQIKSIDELLTGCFPDGSTIELDANWIQAQLKAYQRTANSVKHLEQVVAAQSKNIEYYKQRTQPVIRQADYYFDSRSYNNIFDETC